MGNRDATDYQQYLSVNFISMIAGNVKIMALQYKVF